MTVPDYEQTLTEPLVTDALIEQRVTALVGRAARHQLWFLFLDQHEVQLPLVLPFSDPPAQPDASLLTLASIVELAVEAENASAVIVVVERYADATFTTADKLWARGIVTALGEREVAVRAVLLSHRRGVRWFAQDDYGLAETSV
ncbi:hypothetical protein [Glaciihabitans sp. UYNi722]|uniref:hypothetical protein n=1 Tax=Glaciihabitans sp. UYNi722 TaxID=3156344 RepID=UPI003395DBA9